jgi:hypothetical protein
MKGEGRPAEPQEALHSPAAAALAAKNKCLADSNKTRAEKQNDQQASARRQLFAALARSHLQADVRIPAARKNSAHASQ